MNPLFAATCFLTVVVGARAQASFRFLDRTEAPTRAQFGDIRSSFTDLLSDLDSDGDLEFVTPRGFLGPSVNAFAGSGRFDSPLQLPASSHCNLSTWGFAIGDVDADGDLDILKTNYDAVSPCYPVLLLGDQALGFTDVSVTHLPSISGSNFFSVAALGDVDGDGDLDAILGGVSTNTANRVLMNDGSGHFTDSPPRAFTVMQAGMLREIQILDVDGDDDNDLAIGLDAGSNLRISQILLNDGTGIFAPGPSLPMNAIGNPVLRFGDVDSDGDLDLLMFGDTWYGLPLHGPAPELLINDGSGTFLLETSTRLPSHNEEQHGALADFDNDGDLDIIAPHFMPVPSATHPGENTVWAQWVNDGTGHFVTASQDLLPRTAIADYVAGPVYAGDVDDDGDIDIVTGFDRFFQPGVHKVLWNMRRQLHVPAAAHLNGTLNVDVWADQGHIVSLLVGFYGDVRYDLGPWGSLRLDPGRLIMTAARWMTPSRVTSYQFSISSDPVFLGLDVHLQAIDGHPSDLSQLYLTGVWSETILP